MRARFQTRSAGHGQETHGFGPKKKLASRDGCALLSPVPRGLSTLLPGDVAYRKQSQKFKVMKFEKCSGEGFCRNLREFFPN